MKKILPLLTLSLLLSCTSENTKESISETKENNQPQNSIELTSDQIKVSGIKAGKLIKRKLSETVEGTGYIKVPPENVASVSPVITGFITRLNYYPGDYVSKGDELARLKHPMFIELQEKYIYAKSQTEYYEQEYKRQGELTVENAASIKKMQKAKADYFSNEAQYKSLKAQLQLLGVKTGEIEKGNFVHEFFVNAPISGTISKVNANQGLLVNPDTYIYEIINDNKLYLHFKVFENDIPKIRVGQKILFWTLNDSLKYTAKIEKIGVNINQEDRTMLIQSTIDNNQLNLKSGMFINGTVYINERESYTVPSEAVIRFNNQDYVIIQNQSLFVLKKVKKGIEQNKWIEIINPGENLVKSDIIIKGTYFILSKLEAES